MNSKNLSDSEREMSHSHLIQLSMPIIFLIITILDSELFQLSTWFKPFFSFTLRITLFTLVFIIALIMIYLSHKALFNKNKPSDKLITNGILKYVRNPLYLGVLLIYIAIILLTISLIACVLFIIIFLIYNRMVNYEERKLEQLFGEDYLDYKRRVSKWIPNPFKKV